MSFMVQLSFKFKKAITDFYMDDTGIYLYTDFMRTTGRIFSIYLNCLLFLCTLMMTFFLQISSKPSMPSTENHQCRKVFGYSTVTPA